jgi:hypothetical protein
LHAAPALRPHQASRSLLPGFYQQHQQGWPQASNTHQAALLAPLLLLPSSGSSLVEPLSLNQLCGVLLLLLL